MSLAVGTRIGSFEVTAAIGAGGMGEVYRARDAKLGRDVALKVLPEAFAADADRLARFEREAQLLAALNHPNIAAIHGLEEASAVVGRSGPVRALVLELVEGPTLAERIAGGACAVEEAVAIARQVAAALEAAHGQGIIHRDLKPANIKVRPDGTVKVLDFGLAKLTQRQASGAGEDGRGDAPTVTTPALLTCSGIILGTAAYMSPEQAKAQEADKRSDLWAFGCVFFELLTGTAAFQAGTVSETLAAVLRGEPEWTRLPAQTPAPLRALLRRCLAKDRSRRIADASVVQFVLAELGTVEEADSWQSGVVRADAPGRTGPMARFGWPIIAAGLALALLAVLWTRPRTGAADGGRALTASLLPPAGTTFDFEGLATPALSPDGRWVVFGARSTEGTSQLWLQRLDNGLVRQVAGSELGYMPFWSPDSRRFGFAVSNRLVKTDTDGTPAVTLTTLASVLGGASWGERDEIVYSTRDSTSPISRIPAAGGTPIPVTTVVPEQEPRGHRAPWFLPDGRHFLYTIAKDGDMPVRVGSIDGPTEPGPIVALAHSPASYAAGHLLYLRDGTAMAQPFDAGRLMVTGEAMPLAQDIQTFLTPIRFPSMSASRTGTLVYQSGRDGERSSLVWKDRTGKVVSDTIETEGAVREIRLSPDGKALATSSIDGNGTRAIWIYDLADRIGRRFTFDPTNNYSPVWAPDSQSMYWRSSRTGGGIYRQSVTGSGTAELLLSSTVPPTPTSVSPDGETLAFHREGQSQTDLWLLQLPNDPSPKTGDPRPLLQSPADEGLGQFSPDGKWLMYVSRESGRSEIYLAPYSGGGAKRQVSSGGGINPRWRRDGREVYYLTLSGGLRAVEIGWQGETPILGRGQDLFDGLSIGTGYVSDVSRGYSYDVSPDGQKFIVVQDRTAQAPPLTIVQNWNALLRK